nr:DNA helicase [Anaerolineae bacterium]
MTLSAKHKAIKAFYEARESIQHQRITNELGLREPFKALLTDAAHLFDLELVIEQSHRLDQRLIRFDGVIRDVFRRDRGYWEAKDQDDKLEDEIAKKFAAGYPNRNI